MCHQLLCDDSHIGSWFQRMLPTNLIKIEDSLMSSRQCSELDTLSIFILTILVFIRVTKVNYYKNFEIKGRCTKSR